jgi:hypothetical protein
MIQSFGCEGGFKADSAGLIDFIIDHTLQAGYWASEGERGFRFTSPRGLNAVRVTAEKMHF